MRKRGFATARNAAEFSLDEHVERLAAGETATLDRRVGRDAIANAEFDLEAARKALAKIRNVVHEYEATAERVEERVKTAIGEVVAVAIDPILLETEALKRRLNANCAVLRFLSGATPTHSEAGRRANRALPSCLPGEPLPGPMNHPAVEPWRAALEALSRDADAQLPSGG